MGDEARPLLTPGKGAAGGGRYASAGSSASATTTPPKRQPVVDDNVSTPVPYAQQQRIDEDRSHANSQHEPPDTPARAFLRKAGRTAAQMFPPLTWAGGYRLGFLKGDVIAGLTIGIMGIPQGMAYALIAGLPAIVGLYASTVPSLVYSLFGTSKELVYGPIAIVSLIVERGLSPLAEPGTADYAEKVYFMSFLVGIIFIIMGLLRLGFVVNFFSKPVLSAFISASALIIASEQVKYLLGVSFPRQAQFYGTVYQLLRHMNRAHLLTLEVGLVALALLFVCRRLKRRLPYLEGPVIAVGLGTLCAWLFDWEARGIRLVGAIPSGFPSPLLPIPSAPDFPIEEGTNVVGEIFEYYYHYTVELFPVALALALVGYMSSVSIATKVADMKKYEIDPSQELIALGLANFVGSFFSSFPGAGSLSRTMVNAQAGANSPLASAFGVGVILLVIFFFTPIFYFLPYVVLGSIVIMAVLPLIEYQEFFTLWRLKRREGVLWITTVAATLVFGIINGIVISVAFSMVLVIYRSSRPHIDILGRLPGSTTYRNVKRFPQALVIPRMVILRLDAALYFANIGFLKERLRNEEKKKIAPLSRAPGKDVEEDTKKLYGVVVLDWSSINDIDYSACVELMSIVKEYKANNILFIQAALKGPVRDTMLSGGLVDLIGKENFYWDVHDAVVYGQRMLEAAYGRTDARPTAFGGGDTEEEDFDVDEFGTAGSDESTDVDDGGSSSNCSDEGEGEGEDGRSDCGACEDEAKAGHEGNQERRSARRRDRHHHHHRHDRRHGRSTSGGRDGGRRHSSPTREGDLEATSAVATRGDDAGGEGVDECYDYSPRIFHTLETSPDHLPRSSGRTTSPPPGLLQRTPIAAPHPDQSS